MSGDTSNPNGAHHGSRLAFAWEMARGDRMAWFTTVINALFTHLFRALLPIIYALIVDEVIVRGELSLVPAIALCFGILLVANEGLFAIGHVSWVYKITDFDSKVRRRLFSRILDANTELLERRRTGDLAETVETDANQITWYVDVFAVWIPDALIALVIALIFMTAISPVVAFMASVAAPLSAFISHRMAVRGRRIADEHRDKYGALSSWLFEIIRGVADIQQLGATTTVARWLVDRLRALIGLKVRASIVEFSSDRVRELVALILEIGFFLAASALVLADRLSLGGYVAVATYFATALSEVSELSSMLFRMRLYTVGVDRIRSVVELAAESDGGRSLDRGPGSVEFDRVRFRYHPDVPVLEGISFRVDAGERVAIVGGSGVGKSSIVSLLARLHDPEAGSIMIGRRSLAQFSRRSVRRWFGFVQQEPLIFSDTVRANLCLGEQTQSGESIPDESLWDACRTAQISETLHGFPEGLDTPIGSEGRTLSAGEKQRVELARVLLRSPSVLVIDEGLSAVDPDTERAIYRRLFTADSRGRSTIIIAHRLSTIIDCDRVVVLDGGAIVASGSHEELIRDCAVYQRLFRDQME